MRNFRINVAELIVSIAKIFAPDGYILEGERAMAHTVLEVAHLKAEREKLK